MGRRMYPMKIPAVREKRKVLAEDGNDETAGAWWFGMGGDDGSSAELVEAAARRCAAPRRFRRLRTRVIAGGTRLNSQVRTLDITYCKDE